MIAPQPRQEKRAMHVARRPSAPVTRAFEMPISAMGAISKLNDEAYGPSEWYLYTYLCFVGQLKNTNPFRTSVYQLRKAWEFEGVEVQPIRMAINTLKSAMDVLERQGLISVERTKQGVNVHLDITIH